MAVVSKTTKGYTFVGSNPTPAALRLAYPAPPRDGGPQPGLVQGEQDQPDSDNSDNGGKSDTTDEKAENGSKCECDGCSDSKHGGSIPQWCPAKQGPVAQSVGAAP